MPDFGDNLVKFQPILKSLTAEKMSWKKKTCDIPFYRMLTRYVKQNLEMSKVCQKFTNTL